MRKLSLSDLNRLSVDEFKKASKTQVVVVLDNLRSAHNVGAVFRTADAFLLESIYLCGITASPPNRELKKTAIGAENSVAWRYFEKSQDALIALRNMKYKIIAIEHTDISISLKQFHPKKQDKYAVIFGNEVEGIQEELLLMADIIIEIPQFGTKHSLNVSVCSGIILWEFFSKMML